MHPAPGSPQAMPRTSSSSRVEESGGLMGAGFYPGRLHRESDTYASGAGHTPEAPEPRARAARTALGGRLSMNAGSERGIQVAPDSGRMSLDNLAGCSAGCSGPAFQPSRGFPLQFSCLTLRRPLPFAYNGAGYVPVHVTASVPRASTGAAAHSAAHPVDEHSPASAHGPGGQGSRG